MNELIKIQDRNGNKAVSARELYTFLDVKKDFTTWCKRMFGYGFTESRDFTPVRVESTGGRPSTDYALTIDCAKEISMLQRTEKGKAAREYFIEMEKVAVSHQTTIPNLSPAEALLQTVQMLVHHEKKINLLEQRMVKIESSTQQTRPNYFTILGYATINHLQVGFNIAKQLGQKASRICRERGCAMDEVPDPRFGRVRAYPANILQEVFADPIW